MMEVALAVCDLVRAACSKDIQLLDVLCFMNYIDIRWVACC